MKNCSNLEAFRKNLLGLVNNCHLSIGEAYYVLRDVMNELRFVYVEQLYQEQQSENNIEEVEEEFIPLNPIEQEEVTENDEQNND